MITFCFPVQMIFTVYLYVKTFAHAKRETEKGRKIFDLRSLQITRVHFYVAIVGIVLYLPWLVLHVIPGDLSYPYRHYGLVVMSASCCIDPIIYLMWHPDIRDVTGEMYKVVVRHGTIMNNVVV